VYLDTFREVMTAVIGGEDNDVGLMGRIECDQYSPHVVVDAQELRAATAAFT
jgi:hypothetical protein